MKRTGTRVLTLAEAAARSGLSKATLNRAAKLGGLPATRIPGGHLDWMVRARDVDAFVKARGARKRKARGGGPELGQANSLPFQDPWKGKVKKLDPAPVPAPGQDVRLVTVGGFQERVDLTDRAARNLGMLKHWTAAPTAEVLDAALVALARELGLHGVE